MNSNKKNTLRLILGDQLNINHSWYTKVDESITYVMMEIRSETDYVEHHIQKVIGFFAAMRNFANELTNKKHKVIYLKLNDENNLQSFDKNCNALIEKYKYNFFEYQLSDEYRVDEHLKSFTNRLKIPFAVVDTEHFYSTRDELAKLFNGKKTFLMETFYRYMRKQNSVLIVDGDRPLNGKWNFDEDNRQKLPKAHKPVAPLVFDNDLSEILAELKSASIKTMGNIDAKILFGQ